MKKVLNDLFADVGEMLEGLCAAHPDHYRQTTGWPGSAARIFGENSVGFDDPGMLAFRHMLRGLEEREGT